MAKFRLTENGIAAAARGIGAALDAAGAAGALELYDRDGGALLARLRFQRPAVADVVGGDVKFFGLSPELDAPGRGRATVKRVFRASGMASFTLAAEGSATCVLEPELMSPEALMALLVALDDSEMEDA